MTRVVRYTVRPGNYEVRFFTGAHELRMQVAVEHEGELAITLEENESCDITETNDACTAENQADQGLEKPENG